MLDIEKLTLGEVATIERLSGLSVSTISADDSPKGLMMAALCFVAKRRDGDPITWNDAQDLTMDQANDILGLDELATSDDDGEGDGAPEEDAAAPLPSPRPRTRTRSKSSPTAAPTT